MRQQCLFNLPGIDFFATTIDKNLFTTSNIETSLLIFFAEVTHKEKTIFKLLATQFRHIEIASSHRSISDRNFSYAANRELIQRFIGYANLRALTGSPNRVETYILIRFHIQSNRAGFCTSIDRAQRHAKSLLKAGKGFFGQEITSRHT